LNDLYELSEEAGQSRRMLSVTTPIGLLVSNGLVLGEQESPLFKFYLPEMRGRIQDQMGVQLPGVRVTESDDVRHLNSYGILLDEVRVAMGHVQPGMRYCPVAPEKLKGLGIGDDALVEAPHPLTGQTGCWITESAWPLVTERQVELWDDPLLYMVYHLEAVLRRNLPAFLGTQEFKNLLETWRTTEKPLVDSAAPDQSRELRLGRTLRALLNEQVAITSWQEILKTIQIVGLPNDDVHEVVRAVRLSLKRQLPGNTPDAHRLELQSGIEGSLAQWLRHEHGKTFIAIPPEPVKEFLSAVRKLVETNHDNALLVVESGKLRPFIHRIIKQEFSSLIVLAREELIAPGELYDAARAKDQTWINGVSADA
jgi:flagellar biosynthesis component FlhA